MLFRSQNCASNHGDPFRQLNEEGTEIYGEGRCQDSTCELKNAAFGVIPFTSQMQLSRMQESPPHRGNTHVGNLHAAAIQQRNITVDHIRNMRREGGRSPLRLESNGLKRAVHTGHVNVVTIIGGGNATS